MNAGPSVRPWIALPQIHFRIIITERYPKGEEKEPTFFDSLVDNPRQRRTTDGSRRSSILDVCPPPPPHPPLSWTCAPPPPLSLTPPLHLPIPPSPPRPLPPSPPAHPQVGWARLAPTTRDHRLGEGPDGAAPATAAPSGSSRVCLSWSPGEPGCSTSSGGLICVWRTPQKKWPGTQCLSPQNSDRV